MPSFKPLGDAAQIQKLDLGVAKQVERLGIGDDAAIQRAFRHTTQPAPTPSYSPDQPSLAARLRPGSRPSSMPIPGQQKTVLEELETRINSMDKNPLEDAINKIGNW